MLKTKLGRLRALSLAEGISLIVLVLVAMPVKYFMAEPMMVKVAGPIHGGLFLLFGFMTVAAGVENKWKSKTTALLLFCAVIPFGCFYAENKIFRNLEESNEI